MSKGILGLFSAALLVLINLPAFAAGKDGTGPSKDDLVNLCVKATMVCLAACQRSGTFSGQLSQSFCEDDCRTTGNDCVASIPIRRKNKGTTGVGNNRKPANAR